MTTLRAVPLATAKIIAEVDGGIGWLRINQPERRNAISLEMWQGLADATAAFEADDAVRVVVMHGVGRPLVCRRRRHQRVRAAARQCRAEATLRRDRRARTERPGVAEQAA